MKILISALLYLASVPVFGSSTTMHSEEIEIYNVLINHGLGPTSEMVVIASETTGDPIGIALQDGKIELITELGATEETLLDWQGKNKQQVPIKVALTLNVSYQVLNERERESIFNNEDPQIGWQNFFAYYENTSGLLRLSRVGFDIARKHALVYVEYQCGAACGSGRLVHLIRKTDDVWSVNNATLMWMAD
jgi:hypothetical protein